MEACPTPTAVNTDRRDGNPIQNYADCKESSSRSTLYITSEPKQEWQAAITLLEVSIKTALAKARG